MTFDPISNTVSDEENPIEAERRTQVIREAITWIGTPFRFTQQEKGRHGGTDCGNFVMAVFAACGWPPQRFVFDRQWFKNRTDEIYRAELEKRAVSVPFPRPGDIALFHVGKLYWHGAIVISWPNRVIHCTEGHGVEYGSPKFSRMWPPLFFDPYARLTH